MNTTEDRARVAMLAIASTVGDAPPLRLAPAPDALTGRPPRRARSWRGWMAPVAAAVVMLAVGVTLAVVRGNPSGPVTPPVPAFSHGVPRYYVALEPPTVKNPNPAKVVVGDTFSGKRLLTLGPLAGGAADSVTAAADDLTFVVSTGQPRPPGSPRPTAWYLIRITPGSRASATVRALPISVPSNFFESSMALSPDGTELAMIGSQGPQVIGPLTREQVVLRIYSVATGSLLRTWASPPARRLSVWFSSQLWWTDYAHALAFGYDGQVQSNSVGFWLLQVNRPGNNLFANSRLAWSTQVPGNFSLDQKRAFSCAGIDPSVLVTGDGKTIVCGAIAVLRPAGDLLHGTCPAVPPRTAVGFLEYSTATGKLARTVYRYNTSCVSGPVPASQVFWSSATGDAVIGDFNFFDYHTGRSFAMRFGVFRDHTFTPLPAPPSTEAGTIAW